MERGEGNVPGTSTCIVYLQTISNVIIVLAVVPIAHGQVFLYVQ